MANELAKFFGNRTAGADQQTTAKALGALGASKAALLGDRALLRLRKSGDLVFGIDNEEMPEGAQLYVDPATMSSGYVAWHKGQIENEVMQPVSAGPVDTNTLKEVQAKKGWESQLSVDMYYPEAKIKMVYKTSSTGGKRALMDLAADMALAMHDNPARAYAVVRIEVDSYEHREFGTVYFPVFHITGWLDEAGAQITERKRLV